MKVNHNHKKNEYLNSLFFKLIDSKLLKELINNHKYYTKICNAIILYNKQNEFGFGLWHRKNEIRSAGFWWLGFEELEFLPISEITDYLLSKPVNEDSLK